MALAAFHPLVRIESANAAAFCGLYRLTVSTLETLGEANAIGSLFAVDKRLRSTQREC
jgi:hypothetical protein